MERLELQKPICPNQLEGAQSCKERDFFSAVQALTSDLLFRFDLQTNQIHYFGSAQKALNLSAMSDNFPQCMVESELICSEDVPALLSVVEQMHQSVEEPSYFRFYHEGKELHWYRMDYKLILDERCIPLEAVGKLTNIQQQRELEERINIDALTGCLRKDAFETLVSDYMQKYPNGRGIFFIVDLDNFKAVNDNLGHQFGDRVLRRVGDQLHNLFRGDDFIGRIGGDEFMVMLVGTDNLELGKRKAAEIIAALDSTYTGDTRAYRISASVGMAIYPLHGEGFRGLYDRADMALFEAKNHGKNGYVVYHNTLSKGTMENTLPYEVAARTLAQHYDPQVVEESFNLLFETKELEISIQAVLEVIGTRFGVSRCYIFEQHPTIKDTYQNTYEWCNEGISEEKWRLDAVPMDLLQEFFQQANEDGILYCNDLSLLSKKEGREIMEAQNIKSFLHTYIASDGEISYVIGVDECNTRRVWSPIEVSTILQTSKIIAQFLSYKKALLDVQTIAQERLFVLNSMHYYSYIIDKNAYQLTYFNEFMRKTIPGISLGQHCYQVIRKNSAPCKDCPIKVMEEQGSSSVRTLISGSTLGRKLLTVTSVQPSLGGRECVYVTAIDLDDVCEIEIED